MAKGSKYPVEFHERAVRLARGTDRPITDVARDLGVHPKRRYVSGYARMKQMTVAGLTSWLQWNGKN